METLLFRKRRLVPAVSGKTWWDVSSLSKKVCSHVIFPRNRYFMNNLLNLLFKIPIGSCWPLFLPLKEEHEGWSSANSSIVFLLLRKNKAATLASGTGGACTARVGAVLKEFNPNRIYQIFQIGRNRDLILNIME